MQASDDRKRRLDSDGEQGSDEYEECDPLPPKRNKVDSVIVTVPIPETCVGWIIGKAGTTVKKISQQSGCRLQISTEKLTSGYRLVDIEGAPGSIDSAKQLINELITEAQATPVAITAEILIPREKCGMIIGRGGDMMRKLRSASDCYVTLIQPTDDDSAPKVLKIVGLPDKVEIVRKMVDDIISSSNCSLMAGNGGATKAVQVRVPRVAVGAIIGVNGKNIAKLSQETNTKMQFAETDDMLLDERMMAIIGHPNCVDLAVSKIKEIVDANSVKTSDTLFLLIIPASKCGLIIGRGGETIRGINAESGARCELSREPSQNTQEKTFVIRGTEIQVEHAKHLMGIKLGDIPPTTPFNPFGHAPSTSAATSQRPLQPSFVGTALPHSFLGGSYPAVPPMVAQCNSYYANSPPY